MRRTRSSDAAEAILKCGMTLYVMGNFHDAEQQIRSAINMHEGLGLGDGILAGGCY